MPATPTPIQQQAGAGPAGDGGTTRVKVCGITEPAELDVLAARAVDFVGLWYGVPGGPAELPLSDWRQLAAAAAETEHLAPVMVTFLKDIDAMREALEGSHVCWVQLHGYQMPGLVRAVKEIAPDIRVLKVLHVRGGDCVEAPLIASYEKAGVDLFLFDAVAEDGRVGSTGETLDPAVVASLAERISRPFLLAGGLSADNRSDYQELTTHPRFLGIDVDTNARGPDGKVSAERVEAILRAWRAEDPRDA
jgi:phosphoribosylanthranilate isomerase